MGSSHFLEAQKSNVYLSILNSPACASERCWTSVQTYHELNAMEERVLYQHAASGQAKRRSRAVVATQPHKYCKCGLGILPPFHSRPARRYLDREACNHGPGHNTQAPVIVSRLLYLSQLVWKSSSQLGCAVVTCPGSAAMFGASVPYKSLTCEYSNQRGNWQGEFVANVLPPGVAGT